MVQDALHGFAVTVDDVDVLHWQADRVQHPQELLHHDRHLGVGLFDTTRREAADTQPDHGETPTTTTTDNAMTTTTDTTENINNSDENIASTQCYEPSPVTL